MGCALIRAHLGIDPEALNEEDWAISIAQSLWIEKRKEAQMQRAVALALGGDG